MRELAYAYTFEVGESAGQSRELIAFRWHPDPDQLIRFPHAHLGHGSGERRHGLDKAHIPTGRLAIAEIIRFAITELGVEPLRADWEELLEAELPGR